MLHLRTDSFVPNRVYLVVLYGNTENVNNSWGFFSVTYVSKIVNIMIKTSGRVKKKCRTFCHSLQSNI